MFHGYTILLALDMDNLKRWETVAWLRFRARPRLGPRSSGSYYRAPLCFKHVTKWERERKGGCSDCRYPPLDTALTNSSLTRSRYAAPHYITVQPRGCGQYRRVRASSSRGAADPEGHPRRASSSSRGIPLLHNGISGFTNAQSNNEAYTLCSLLFPLSLLDDFIL